LRRGFQRGTFHKFHNPDKNLTERAGLPLAGSGKILLPFDFIHIFIMVVFGLILADFTL
jgi:hypothetical protein